MTMRPIIQVPQVTLSEVCQDTALLDAVTQSRHCLARCCCTIKTLPYSKVLHNQDTALLDAVNIS